MNKLFVWDDVLRDYTAGIMFAIAPDADAARAAILAVEDVIIEDDLAREPKVYELTETVARAVWGGG